MQKLSLLIVSLFLSSPAFCSPYFRFAGSESKGPFSGGWDVDAGDISAFSNGEQYGVTDVALITHSTKPPRRYFPKELPTRLEISADIRTSRPRQ